MTIKAIETVWAGYRFRSRLEARWAVFFDALGLQWEYEPEGFQGSDGTRYLPDFRVKIGTKAQFFEVKGDPDWLRKNRSEVVANPVIEDGLILLGQPPFEAGMLFLPEISATHDGPTLTWLLFNGGGFQVERAFYRCHFSGYERVAIQYCQDEFLSFQPKVARTPLALLPIVYAYRAAKEARFEHGQAPTPRSATVPA